MTDTTAELAAPDDLTLAEAREQLAQQQDAAELNARKREDERRARAVRSLESALARQGIAWPGDHAVTHVDGNRRSTPDVTVDAGPHRFGWISGANELVILVDPSGTDLDGEDPRWTACSTRNVHYPLAWLAQTWDRGLRDIAASKQHREDRERRAAERAADPDLDPANRTPDPYRIDRASPLGQLVTGILEVLGPNHGPVY